jgi:hypothetical protein
VQQDEDAPESELAALTKIAALARVSREAVVLPSGPPGFPPLLLGLQVRIALGDRWGLGAKSLKDASTEIS